jgi:hypothetical protein
MEAKPVLQPIRLISNCSSDSIQRSQAARKVTSQRGNRDISLQTHMQVLFFFSFATSLF